MIVISAVWSFLLVYSEFFPQEKGKKFLHLVHKALAINNIPEQKERQLRPDAAP